MQLIANTVDDSLGEGRSRRRIVLLTSYTTRAHVSKTLGRAGYSHDLVAKLYLPLLEKWGEVVPVVDPSENLDKVAAEYRDKGFDPVHFSVIPLQDVYLSPNVPNIAVPAWEFPDIPDHGFDAKPQNDWAATADKCDLLLVGGGFTERALRNGGATGPIRIVQVPTPDEYFQVATWNPKRTVTLRCKAAVFEGNAGNNQLACESSTQPNSTKRKTFLRKTGETLQGLLRKALEKSMGRRYTEAAPLLKQLWRVLRQKPRFGTKLFDTSREQDVELSGIVYTSIFSPRDGRKNWTDLITGFLTAFRERPDVTLVLKLVTSDPQAVAEVLKYYRDRDLPHQCKVVFLSGYLSEEDMVRLTEATTYYVQTTRAEGNCLPLMNYLAAGRPGISPCHTAISDYFTPDVGFVIDSHPEPAAWPHDSRLRIRTTWARIVWPSYVEQLERSYQVVVQEQARYQRLAHTARERMHDFVGVSAVTERLHSALDDLLSKNLGHESQSRVFDINQYRHREHKPTAKAA